MNLAEFMRATSSTRRSATSDRAYAEAVCTHSTADALACTNQGGARTRVQQSRHEVVQVEFDGPAQRVVVGLLTGSEGPS